MVFEFINFILHEDENIFLIHGIDFENFLLIVLITFKGMLVELARVQFAFKFMQVIRLCRVFLNCSFLELHSINNVSKYNTCRATYLMLAL